MLYLASSSPRRRMLLERLRLPFFVLAKPVNEVLDVEAPPRRQAEILAERKARVAAGDVSQGLVIGADTLVVCSGRVLGKPADAREAEKMLRLLQGRQHDVYTGVTVVEKPAGRVLVACEQTRVKFKPLTESEIKRYVATGEPLGKAGAYAAQGLGAIFIDGIKGCFFNVVGLPVARLAQMLKEFGVDVLDPGRL